MNRKGLFVILAMLTALTACSGKGEEKSAPDTTTANNYTVRETDTTVTGEVVSVTENEVTLALGSLREDKREKPDLSGEKPDFNGERPEPPDGDFPDKGERPDFNGERPDFGGEKPSMPEGGEFPSGGRKRSSGTIEKTGAEESYIIPVGMSISGLSGRNTDYKGITEGMILTLTINSDGVVCAASAE